ncbi:hypothetical protein GOSPT_005_00020 [Gordonia sputi NBRC 100414]|uniref:Uncharacterized protein n=1 Tax=Gordonia sputi NBRC 100414 TaxID=1089453 RepID=H5TUV6_9ACTN|nr:hypothetical protein GOSPT_005_00020 [Gordonia sputi NBRC 100414]
MAYATEFCGTRVAPGTGKSAAVTDREERSEVFCVASPSTEHDATRKAAANPITRPTLRTPTNFDCATARPRHRSRHSGGPQIISGNREVGAVVEHTKIR